MLNVVAFGEALIDMIPDYGGAAPGTARPRGFIPSPGGAPANLAVAVAKLGGRAFFLGKVGSDCFGDLIQGTLAGYGVRTDHLLRDPAPTALAFVTHDAGGERRFSFYRDASADLGYRPEDFPDACFAEPGLFHVCSNTLTEAGIRETTEHGLRLARRRGFLISVDVNYRASLWRDPGAAPAAIRHVMAQADLVKMSHEELNALYGAGSEDRIIRHLLEAGVRLVVVTDGARPLRFVTPRYAGDLQPPSIEAVDTTAAGDSFAGALLQALAAGDVSRKHLEDWLSDEESLRSTLRTAAYCGALTASRYGACDALPAAAEVALPTPEPLGRR